MTDNVVREYILIIEDDAPIARIMLRALHRAGYHASAALNADEAFNAIDDQTPDLILLDATLPVVDGIEICGILRAKPATRQTPILFVTGDASQKQRLAATQAGVDGFLAKPFQVDELTDRVRTMIAAKHGVDESGAKGS